MNPFHLRVFLAAVLAASFVSSGFADSPLINVEKLGLGMRIDTAAFPAPGKKPYKPGQRVVYTIWADNDNPYDSVKNVFIRMPAIPPGQRLDLSPAQPSYGNIFTDSRFPAYRDTPSMCRLYYVSRQEGETRHLSVGTAPEDVRRVFWVCTRGRGLEVIGPHDGNENMYGTQKADVRFGAPIDKDEMYVRYAVIVEGSSSPKKKK